MRHLLSAGDFADYRGQQVNAPFSRSVHIPHLSQALVASKDKGGLLWGRGERPLMSTGQLEKFVRFLEMHPGFCPELKGENGVVYGFRVGDASSASVK